MKKLQVSYQSEVGTSLVQTFFSWSPNLSELSVSNCGNLEEVFSNSMTKVEEHKEEMNRVVVFPMLKNLWLKNLRNLKRLFPQWYIEFPTLTTFHISECPVIKGFIFDDKVSFYSSLIIIIY